MAVARDTRALPPPRRISHAWNLVWWVLLLALAGGGYYAETIFTHSNDKPVLPTGSEREAFLAVSFGKIADQGPDVIPAAAFRDHIRSLRGAGYTAVGLDSLEAFYGDGRPLPDRPIVLVFDNVQRDSIEIADRALAETNFRAIAFVDVDALANGNIDLVSRHRLHQLAESGRWDIGVSACPQADTPNQDGSTAATTQTFKKARALVEEWTDQPVRVINCERALAKDESAEWRKALVDGAYRFGLVVANPRLNYADDSPLELRRVRVAREWSANDLLASLGARMPRRDRFVDAFDQPAPKADWIADRADLAIADGSLRITAREGAGGGVVFLGGTDRWSDAEATVSVAERPDGQFWMSLRASPSAYVRFGVSHGRAVLQKSEANEMHEYGSRELPAKGFVLALRVVGGRATATLDGTPIGDRPVEMPASVDRGPLSLAVWDTDGKASVRVKRVEASPVNARAAVVAAVPGVGVWDDLRRDVDELSTLSPRYFSWRDGRSTESGTGDAALSIFARHHRLHFLPVVDLGGGGFHPDLAALGTQLLRWAREPAYDGLNLLVHSKLVEDAHFRSLVNDLRKRLEGEGRTIAVTVADVKGDLPGRLRGFGDIYAMDGSRGGALEFAVAPISLVGTPAG